MVVACPLGASIPVGSISREKIFVVVNVGAACAYVAATHLSSSNGTEAGLAKEGFAETE